MTVIAHSFISDEINSREAGMAVGRRVGGGFELEEPAVILCHATVNHDQAAFLEGLRQGFGRAVPTLGCSAQGIMGRGIVTEEGYAAGAIGLGGSSLTAKIACVEEIQDNAREKGARLGKKLMASLDGPPRLVILYYDPLCGVDVMLFLEGLSGEIHCPILGGAASQPYGLATRTYQYFDERALGHAAVAVALSGSFAMDMDNCHGTTPVGLEMTVTKSNGTMVLEVDGRSALDAWGEFASEGPGQATFGASLAVGLPVGESGLYMVRATYAVDPEAKGVILGTALPPGTRVMLHHRVVDGVLHGTAEMGDRLHARLEGKTVRAVLGWECGARTKPFLGLDLTLEENRVLQAKMPADVEWFGMLPWGELYPVAGRPAFHNYCFPVLALLD